MAETAQAFAWVASTASADSALVAAATGGIWMGFADLAVTSPFMSYGRQAGSDVLTLAGVRLWSDILLRLLAIGPSAQFDALATIATRIDVLFKSVRDVGLPTGGGVLSCYREAEVALEQIVNGEQWFQLGGLYRVSLQGS